MVAGHENPPLKKSGPTYGSAGTVLGGAGNGRIGLTHRTTDMTPITWCQASRTHGSLSSCGTWRDHR